MKKLLVLFAFLATSALAWAQRDFDLAEQYYQNGQFTEAKLYYDKLFNEGYEDEIFDHYLVTLTKLNELKTAESLLKKRIKKTKDSNLYVDLGTVYQLGKRDADANEAFQTAIDKTQPYRLAILNLGKKFLDLYLYEWALKTYEKGQNQGKDGYSYAYEIAGVQGSLGKFQEMLNSYLDILKLDANYISQIEVTLMQLVDFDEDEARCQDIKGAILKRIQLEPTVSSYNELLAWFLMQRNDFNGAFTQLNALDKRNNENGNRLINLGTLAMNNKQYDVAQKCFSAVMAKGTGSVYYSQACLKNLQAMGLLLKENPNATHESYVQLDHEYAEINKLNLQSTESALLKRDWAHLKSFYLNDDKSAQALLQEALSMPGIPAKTKAELKLELGDVYLFQGNVWDASLLFSQIELDFRDDVIGHEAKFRNAKISFYTGDFDWAQGQLDVLKASTSKLISNDALHLSLIITDNFNLDTTALPMQQFARADLLLYQNKYTECLATLDSITQAFPNHSLTDDILFEKAQIYERMHLIDSAYACYNELVEIHFMGIYADDALFRMAEIQDKYKQNPQEAHKLYDKILTDFPGSLYVLEARKRFREFQP